MAVGFTEILYRCKKILEMDISTSKGHQFHEAAEMEWICWKELQAEEGDEEDIGSDVADHVSGRVLFEYVGLCGHMFHHQLGQV